VEACRNLIGAVGAAVVDDDHLPAPSIQGSHDLVVHRFQRLVFVEDGDDYGNVDRLVNHPGALDFAKRQSLWTLQQVGTPVY
jgi:hypothetical protein